MRHKIILLAFMSTLSPIDLPRNEARVYLRDKS